METKEYTITWTIDIVATSPEEACSIAKEIQLDPDSTANFFNHRDPDGNGGILRMNFEDQKYLKQQQP